MRNWVLPEYIEDILPPEAEAIEQLRRTLIDHFRNPRNAGMMREPDGVGEGEFAQCMDLARFYLRVREGRVEEARFQAYGCGPTLAACSAGTELATTCTDPTALARRGRDPRNRCLRAGP